MATAELVVAFGARLDGFEGSLRRVNTALEDLKKTASDTSSSISQAAEGNQSAWQGMSNTLMGITRAAVAAAAAITSIRFAGDLATQSSELTGIFNRMQIQLGGLELTTRSTFGNLLETATRSGVAFNTVAESFTRFSIAMQSSSVPATTQEITQLVEMLTRMTQLSGSSQGGAAAIYQLSQGLASGRLQGDELKSILENMPMLAQALARELGVSVGRLREMGSEGRLTAEVVFPALLRAGQGLQDRIQNLPLTVTQAWEATKNQFIAAVNSIDRAIGASSNIVAFLGGLQSILGAVRRGTGGSTPEESRAAAGRSEVQTQTLILRAMTEQARLQGEIETARERGMDTTRLYQQLEIQNQSLMALGVRAEEQGLERIVEGSRAAMEAEIERFRTRQNATTNARNAFSAEALELRRQNDERFRIQDDANRERTRLAERFNAISADQRTTAENLEFIRSNRAIDRQEREQLAALTRREGAQAASAARRAENEIRAEERAHEVLRRRLLAHTSPLLELQEQYSRQRTAIIDLFKDPATSAQAMSVTLGFVQEQAGTAMRQLIAMGENPRQAIEATRVQLEALRTALIGKGADPGENFVERGVTSAERALDQLRIKFQTWSDIARDGIQQFSKTAADGIVDFATGASRNFTKMAEDFAKSIAKMILNAMIFRAIMLGLRSVGIDLTVVIPGRMAGGPVDAGSPYVVGERQPELFVPGSSGYVFPTAGRGGEVTVNVYNNAPNTRATARESTNSTGGKTIEVFVEEIVNRGIATGKFDNSMSSSYGAARIGRV